jgi:hypothetical protein
LQWAPWTRPSYHRRFCNPGGADISLTDLAVVAQIIGALAVVASLVSVGLEIRHNTLTSKAATLRANAAYWLDFFAMAGDPRYGRSFAKGAAGRQDLAGDEFDQFLFLCRAIFMGRENQHSQYRQRMIYADAYEGDTATIREQIASQPGVRAMWSVVRQTYGTEFQSFLDEQIASLPVRGACAVREKWNSEIAAQTRQQA